MEITSKLTKHSSGRDLLRTMLNVFGGKHEIAQAFQVADKTVSNWFSPKGRGPGVSIADRMQSWLPGQQRLVTVHGVQDDGSRDGRQRTLHITLDGEDNRKYERLLADGKQNSAKVFLLAAQHGTWGGVPGMAGHAWDDDLLDLADLDSEDLGEGDSDYVA